MNDLNELFDPNEHDEPWNCAKCGYAVLTSYNCTTCHLTGLCAKCFTEHLRCENAFPAVAKKTTAIVTALACIDLPKRIREILLEGL